jgi:hypothetical protein
MSCCGVIVTEACTACAKLRAPAKLPSESSVLCLRAVSLSLYNVLCVVGSRWRWTFQLTSAIFLASAAAFHRRTQDVAIERWLS